MPYEVAIDTYWLYSQDDDVAGDVAAVAMPLLAESILLTNLYIVQLVTF